MCRVHLFSVAADSPGTVEAANASVIGIIVVVIMASLVLILVILDIRSILQSVSFLVRNLTGTPCKQFKHKLKKWNYRTVYREE